MKTKRFLGFCIPVMITTAAMSAIAFAGCSQDDELDECENTYKTHAEMMMTRAGENTTPPYKPNEIETKHTFSATFLFTGYKKSSIPGSAQIEVFIKTDTLGKYKGFSYKSYPDSYTSISNLSVYPGAGGRYGVSVTAYYTRNASYNSSTYTTTF